MPKSEDVFRQWLAFDPETRRELLALTDEREIGDRFYKGLEFGTGGLRGIMGAGTNRMNGYTVGRAARGLANHLRSECTAGISVVIAYDSRNGSARFAADAACVLCAAGIHAFLFETPMPTPVLSFAVRHLGCQAGICITASHNPREYNGFKAYDRNGCQMVPADTDKVSRQIDAINGYAGIPKADFDAARRSGQLEIVGDDVLEAYMTAVRTQSIYRGPSDLRIVYTPLHGTGCIPVCMALDRFHVSVVPEQRLPDGNFPTVRSPNPEERDALSLAIEQARLIGADLVLGTDPDCDRVGAAVRRQGEYVLLTGNQIGALLVDFVVSNRNFSRPAGPPPALVKTIVTSELGAAIGRHYGLEVMETLTGFKYIGDQISRFERTGAHAFVIGYEESFGYLVGTHARDKDAVVASMLLAEAAAWHKDRGQTLADALDGLYSQYGYYLDALDSWSYAGAEGHERIRAIMAALRERGQGLLPGIERIKDYSLGIDGLPNENVVKLILDDGSWIAVRPSGTEPKIKAYYSIRDPDKANAQRRLDRIRQVIGSIAGSGRVTYGTGQ